MATNYYDITVRSTREGRGYTPHSQTVGATALIVSAAGVRSRNPRAGLMTGAVLGFNHWEALAACSMRLHRLGYHTTAFSDVQARHALLVGSKKES